MILQTIRKSRTKMRSEDMLIEKDMQGNWRVKSLPWKDLHVGTPLTNETWGKLYACLWRLMEYEDTGLTPEQIEQMKEVGNGGCGLSWKN